jgi:hypothetical protein
MMIPNSPASGRSGLADTGGAAKSSSAFWTLDCTPFGECFELIDGRFPRDSQWDDMCCIDRLLIRNIGRNGCMAEMGVLSHMASQGRYRVDHDWFPRLKLKYDEPP